MRSGNAWQFTRKRTLKFVKDMFECGLLRDISASAQVPLEKPRWASAMRASLRKRRAVLNRLPDTPSDPDFDQRIIEQYEQFHARNATASRAASTQVAERRPADIPHDDADARFDLLETPLTKLTALIQNLERRGITLTHEQMLACAIFARMVQTAWAEERAGLPLDKRSCQHMIILGQGGAGQTFLVTAIGIPLVHWAFPPDDEGIDGWCSPSRMRRQMPFPQKKSGR